MGGEVGTGDRDAAGAEKGQPALALEGAPTHPSRLEGQRTLMAPSRPLASLCWAEEDLHPCCQQSGELLGVGDA